jgi:hypothetical protein
LNIDENRVRSLLDSAKKKMYAARLQRPTPYVDKTVYAGWNAMCVSAYLEAARVLDLKDAREFALRSLDRMLSQGWNSERPSTAADHTNKSAPTLKHVIAYSDPKAAQREYSVDGVLDDYAFAVIACLDAYEATADLSYFRFAQSIADSMISGFFDPVSGGFFDTRAASDNAAPLGILGTRRKPFQDSPTPAGNSAAAIALIRLHGYTNDGSRDGAGYLEKAEQTLEVYAGVAGQHGIFAATYGLAVVRFIEAHAQVVVVGDDENAAQLYRAAVRPLSLGTSVLRLDPDKAVAQNLPPALSQTIPNLPALRTMQSSAEPRSVESRSGEPRSFAVLCSGFTCQPPIFNTHELTAALESQTRPAA